MEKATTPNSLHQQSLDEDEDRRNRFQSSNGGENPAHRERAASQPPRTGDQPFLSSPTQQYHVPSSLGGGGSPWLNSRLLNSNRNSGLPQPVPIRSSSFSAHPQNPFSSAMRDRAFPSTFEDDESEGFSDTYDERYVPPSLSRGRTYAQDPSRSRSQSLATATAARPGAVGSPYLGGSAMQSWNESYLSNTNLQRYADMKPPGSSRYGSLGAVGRSPVNIPIGSNGYSSNRQTIDASNMSPFVRDVNQILLDDGPLKGLWQGMNPPRDENGGGGSGTTSRRHSVSVVQPRRGNIVGFNAPGGGPDSPEEPPRSLFAQSGFGGRGGLMLSDDDLASDLGALTINPNDGLSAAAHGHHHHQVQPPSQPSSLPIYAPLSRSPPSRDLISPYQSIGLATPTGGYASSRHRDSPSDSAGGNTPPPHSGVSAGHGHFEQQLAEAIAYNNSIRRSQSQQLQSQQHNHHQQQSDLTARFIPGQGIQYLPSRGGPTTATSQTTAIANGGANGHGNPPSPYIRTRAPSYTGLTSPTSGTFPGGLTSPISPTSSRMVQPQQPPFYPQQIQRRASDAHAHSPQIPSTGPNVSGSASGGGQGGPSLADLGKGVPLHAVPPSWPLFIVEFKAGRTDLFYLMDLTLDIRVGDLVIVEADRGKDLGKVVNDSITLKEVDEWQKEQQAKAAMGGGPVGQEPTSPGGHGGAGGGLPGVGKKEISPKMIYGKAGQQDTQHLVTKLQDEMKALQLCQTKVRAKKLPMEVVDAEYQWDRRKLTFYFIAEKRIDFRELVRELFRLYKTRIWMASLQGGVAFDQ